MSNQISNIDDLLHEINTAPHSAPVPENNLLQETKNESAAEMEKNTEKMEAQHTIEEKELDETENFDDYGNEMPEQKTFTQEEVNERINQAVRERLARLEKKSDYGQQNQAQIERATQQEFEYNNESAESWQQQLESFVEKTVTKMRQKQTEQALQLKEQQAHAEFEEKFRNGMRKFNDYVNVVGQQPITDAMTIASRAMKDPAAFFYAAAKRAPQELQRIAQIPDQYVQMVEIGKLEERMKQSKSGNATKAPKPLGRIQEDGSIPYNSNKKEPTIEDLIAQDSAKRKAFYDSRRRK